MDKNRYERGYKKLTEVSAGAAERIVETMSDIDPELARYLVEFAYGDIYDRPGLDLKSRQVAAIAALTALGTATPQLKIHIHGALNVGCTRQEIVEVFLQTAVFAGFPAATNGLRIADDVFKERQVNR